MRVDKLRIQNLRAIEDAQIELSPGVTVIVGANNAGRSTVLDALAAIVGYRGGVAFSEQDFRSIAMQASAASARPIKVDVTIAPTNGNRFTPGELGQQLPQVTSLGERYFLRLETRWSADPAVAQLTSRLLVLREDETELSTLGRFPFGEALPLHPFGEERDLRRGIGGRWSDWGRIVADAGPPVNVRERAMRRLQGASRYLIRSSPGLVSVGTAIGDAGRSVGLGEMKVTLSAAPDDVDELLHRIGIHVQVTGANRAFAGERHGLGTQGALLFAVYRLFAERFRQEHDSASPVMTIEEPEAHLHPSAQRALSAELAKLPGQVVISSHSPELISPTCKPVLLRNENGKTCIREGTWSSDVASHPRALFARCVLLVEGLEALALDACATAHGFDLHQRGVEVVNASGQSNLPRLWRTFGTPGFGLPVACLCDSDDDSKLTQFLRTLVDCKIVSALPATADQWAVLQANNYFVAKQGQNIEEALVGGAELQVDAALLAITGVNFPDWRSENSSSTLARNRCRRINLTRGGPPLLTAGTSTVSSLSDLEAKIERLSQCKPRLPDVLRHLTDSGKTAQFLPPGVCAAMRWVEQQTRG